MLILGHTASVRSGCRDRLTTSRRVNGGNENRAVGRRARLVCDYIAGMTDRYAVAEHRRLFAKTPELHLSPPEAHDPI
jgi:dGTP triphosphohydrolase